MKEQRFKKRFTALVMAIAMTLSAAMPIMAQTAATSDGFTPVWVVEPTLNLTSFWHCICGEFVDSQERVIDSATGRITNRLHDGHGGGLPGLVFDPILNLLGHPGYLDDYHFYMGMHPADDFDNSIAELDVWSHGFYSQLTSGLIIVAEVDSTMRRVRDWWLDDDWASDDWWYLSHDAYTGRAALMYNRQLVTGFDFNNIRGVPRYDSNSYIFGFFAAQVGDRWGLIDRHGNTIIPFVFSNLMLIDENTAFANFNGSYGILDLNQTKTNAADVPQAPQHNLSTASAWAHDGITNAIAAGLVPQALQNHYTNNITRAEFAALAVLLYETVAGTAITGRVTFNDTNDVNVEKAAYIGIISGTGNNNFSPNMQFNREQAAVIIARIMNAVGQPLPQVAATFADNAQISSWAIESVGQAQAAGIIGGVGNNVFNPQGTFTREQSIITVLRLFDALN